MNWILLYVVFVLIAFIAACLGATMKICMAIFLVLSVIGIIAFMIEEDCKASAARSATLRRMRAHY